MHTDAWDEVFATPGEDAARIAIATQNILKSEAHLCDVIDPLGGSYYVEALTDEMEEKILSVIKQIDDQGGMFAAAESGFVQQMIGKSALAHQERIERGEELVVGVNAFHIEDESPAARVTVERPDPAVMVAHIERLRAFKAARSQAAIARAMDALRQVARTDDENIFAAEIDAIRAGLTHGEVIAVLREELGYGEPLVVA
jgi:methylmalonyl-CoA mutase N-terminal domain/subunit